MARRLRFTLAPVGGSIALFHTYAPSFASVSPRGQTSPSFIAARLALFRPALPASKSKYQQSHPIVPVALRSPGPWTPQDDSDL